MEITTKLVETCGACPEAYDVFLEDGTYIGYMRLRHGIFSVVGYDDELIATGSPEGDGIFEYEERGMYLALGRESLVNYWRLNND